jgi:PAS domain S-box-containing protein
MSLKKEIVFDKLFKVSPFGINIVDLETRQLVQTSTWVVNHIGYTEAEFMALSHNLFESIIHKDDRVNQLAAYNKLMEDPSLLFTECHVRYRKKNGEYVPALVRLSVLEVDESKKPRSALSTAIDISEIIELRERLQTELKKMEIISYKNSHELRGPVATILGLIQLIDYHGLGESVSIEIINALKETVQKLDRVIYEINEHASPGAAEIPEQ